MTTLFLFGAGASFGSGFSLPHPPPLGGDLFDALVKVSKAAKQIPVETAARFRENFESGMDHLWKNHSHLVSPFLSDMAVYFTQFRLHDPYLNYISSILPPDLKPSWSNHYETLIKIILASKTEVIFSTTNYDLLIEEAIENAGIDVSYNFEDSDAYLTLLKFHGSCNFIPELVNSVFRDIAFTLKPGQQMVGTGDGPVDSSIFKVERFIAVDKAEARVFCYENTALSPAIAMYAPSKEVICGRELIREQYQRWLRAVSKAENIVLIGLRIHKNELNDWADPHIWRVIAESSASLHYVGFEDDDFKLWASDNGKTDINILSKTFSDALGPIEQLLFSNGKRMAETKKFDDKTFTPRHGSPFRRYRLT
jgi:hypothetical protein